MLKKKLIFVAAPFSNCEDKELRRKSITKYSAGLLKRGYDVICPMTMGLALAAEEVLPNDSDWWLSWTTNLLSRCDRMVVLTFPGYEESYGVKKELEFATEHNIPIEFISLNSQTLI